MAPRSQHLPRARVKGERATLVHKVDAATILLNPPHPAQAHLVLDQRALHELRPRVRPSVTLRCGFRLASDFYEAVILRVEPSLEAGLVGDGRVEVVLHMQSERDEVDDVGSVDHHALAHVGHCLLELQQPLELRAACRRERRRAQKLKAKGTPRRLRKQAVARAHGNLPS